MNNYEPDLEVLIEILKKDYAKGNEIENINNVFCDNEENLLNLGYFLKKDQLESFFSKIKKIAEDDNEKKENYRNIVKNLVMLYPFSVKILQKVVEYSKDNEKNYIASTYDVTGFMTQSFNYFINSFSQIEKEKELESLIAKNEKYKKITKELYTQIEEINKKGAENKILELKVRELKEEVKKLEEYYSEEYLKKLDDELEQRKIEINKCKEESEKKEKELKNLSKQIISEIKDTEVFENFKELTKKIERSLNR